MRSLNKRYFLLYIYILPALASSTPFVVVPFLLSSLAWCFDFKGACVSYNHESQNPNLSFMLCTYRPRIL